MSRPHRPTRAHASRRPSTAAPAIQRITEVRRVLELETLFERRSQAAILSAIREQNGGDVPPGESYRLLAIRREATINPACRVGMQQEKEIGVA
jgi:hypothetical protein